MPYDSHWVMSPYPQSTMAGFTTPDFGYIPPTTTHDLPPLDMAHNDLNRMPPPLQTRHSPTQKHEHSELPPMAHHSSPHHHQHPQLPMLTVPSHPTWPSMLTNPSQYASQPQHPLHVTARTGPPPPAPPPLKTKMNEREGKPNPRKMLTDDDRRRMCEYAESHPGVKQSEIGAIFGVERSTVSKVLRNKEKYAIKDDRSKSPGAKKSKGSKLPDIERALSNWVRNAQKTGMSVSDIEIKDKLRFFATNTGNPDTILRSASTSSWLEKFKQKNGIGASGRLVRRASETNIPKRKSSINSMSSMGRMESAGNGNDSPLSPITRNHSTSPTSANRSDEERDALSAGPSAGQHFMSFGSDANSNHNHGSHNNNMNMTMGIGISYKTGNNQSTASLNNMFPDTHPSVSTYNSPTAPYTFSPDPNANVGSFLSTDPMAQPGSANFQRPRSQTLPALNIEYMNQQGHAQHQHQNQHHHDHHAHNGHNGHSHNGHSDSANGVSTPGDAMTPKYLHHHHLSSTAPSSAVDSPMTDISGPSYGLDSAVVSPQLRRSGSNGSLFQNNPRSAGGLGGATILGSPLAANGSGLSANGSADSNGTANESNSNGNGSSNANTNGSTPSSPTQDDARRAADTLLTFIKTGPSGFDQTDYMAVARMIEKLRLQQAAIKGHAHNSLNGLGGLGLSSLNSLNGHNSLGGLSQIPEGEGEMGGELSTHHIKAEATLTA